MSSIFHIVAEPDWRAACLVGQYAPASLAEEGFVHFSYAHQVADVANRLYRERSGLLVVEIEPAAVGRPVVEEDLYGAQELFPHIYGTIPTAAALAEHSLLRDAAGSYWFPVASTR